MSGGDGSGLLLIEDVGRVRTITFNRPHALNAMGIPMFDALRVALLAAARDEDVACVILTGAGRAFCAGQDVKEMDSLTMPDHGRPPGFLPCLEEIERFPKPLLAAVNGLAVGFGATVLLHCDIVILAEGARLQFPFARLGLAPEAASSATLPLAIGHQNAARLLYTGDYVDAQEAVTLGLAWQITPTSDLIATAHALADRISRMPIGSLIATKRLLLASRSQAIRAAVERETDVYVRLMGSPAHREATLAFMARRTPDDLVGPRV